jgi:hypothetical protein
MEDLLGSVTSQVSYDSERCVSALTLYSTGENNSVLRDPPLPIN